MVVEYVRPVSLSARWARRAGLAALVIALAAWAATRFGPLIEPHFILLYAVALGLAVVALFGALIGFVSLWRVGAKGGKASIAAVFLVVPVLAPAAYATWLYRSTPPIYEVSTDIGDPPRWIAEPRYAQIWLGQRPQVADSDRAAQTTAYPALLSHRYDASVDRVLEGIRKAVQERRITIRLQRLPKVETDPKFLQDAPAIAGGIPIPRLRPGFVDPDIAPTPQVALLQGTVSDRIAGFPFDVAIRAREDGDTTLVDIRVAARYGSADLGGSAHVAGTFLDALDGAMLGAVGE